MTNDHALDDGDERLAWPATTVLLDLDGRAPELPDDGAVDVGWEVASMPLDIEAIALKLRVPERRMGRRASAPTAGEPRPRRRLGVSRSIVVRSLIVRRNCKGTSIPVQSPGSGPGRVDPHPGVDPVDAPGHHPARRQG